MTITLNTVDMERDFTLTLEDAVSLGCVTPAEVEDLYAMGSPFESVVVLGYEDLKDQLYRPEVFEEHWRYKQECLEAYERQQEAEWRALREREEELNAEIV